MTNKTKNKERNAANSDFPVSGPAVTKMIKERQSKVEEKTEEEKRKPAPVPKIEFSPHINLEIPEVFSRQLAKFHNAVDKQNELVTTFIKEARSTAYESGRLEGIKEIVRLAEAAMIKEFGFKDVEEMALAGKVPAFWLIALVTHFTEARARSREVVKEQSQEVLPSPVDLESE